MRLKDALKMLSSSAPWEPWASEHGWAYEAEQPALAGRFFPLPPDPKKHQERYLDVVTGSLDDRDFVRFHRQAFRRGHASDHIEKVAGLAVRLPGRPRPELAGQDVSAAVHPYADLPGWCSWAWVEPDWLLATRTVMKPQQVENLLASAAFTLERMPSDAFVS